jgi:ABC transport system ATP-binding/permease protein
MLPYLQVENLAKRYGELLLFENISFTINKDQKVALIARNGAGKTSLFDLLAGKDSPDAGAITWTNDIRVGYLQQIPELKPENTIMEEIFDSQDERMKLLKTYETAIARHDEEMVMAITHEMDHTNAWALEVEIRQILTQLKIFNLEIKVNELSGGQQKRLGLAKVLVSKPDFLLLDEPTNHLDLDMIEWLENYLERSNSTLLMVTHDRYFLDRICDEIIELDSNEIFRYQGNYSYFLRKREERLQARQATVSRAQNLLRTELEWMRRMPKARTHKAKYRTDAFYDLREKAKNRHEERTVDLNIRSSRIGKKILEVKKLSKSFGDLNLIDDFSYVFSRFEKVGIIGKNGTGKTTFLELITGNLPPDSGTIDIGTTIRFGYYSQKGISFNPQEKVIDAVNKIAEFVSFEDGQKMNAGQLLTRFLFPPSTQYDFIEKLSGGERRRLYLCTVLMQNPNFLLLDEPTNDLDILTLNVLEEYLRGFDGCVIIVSHDRFFMDKIVDHLFIFNGTGGIRDFPGNYTQYRNSVEEDAATGKQETKAPVIKLSAPPRQDGNLKLSFKEKQELIALEKEIAALELKKKELVESMNSGTLSHPDLFVKSQEIGQINSLLEGKELRWLELSEKE